MSIPATSAMVFPLHCLRYTVPERAVDVGEMGFVGEAGFVGFGGVVYVAVVGMGCVGCCVC